MKRVFLFLMTNIAIMVVLGVVASIVMPLLGLDQQGLPALLVLCAIFGMGGSFISLALSKWMAKRATGAQVIEQPANPVERWLVETVQRQAQAAGIGMPEVAIFPSPEINAFATGMSRNNALVAVSSGLLQGMNRDEAEAVLGHEISHIANGDMITLTLIQGVVNTFVMFFARIAASIVSSAVAKNESMKHVVFIVATMVFQIVFGILASVIVMWFSRQREYRADAGGASLAGKQKMVAALERLMRSHEESRLDGQLTAFGIHGQTKMSELFMSHPPLEKRIEALRNSMTV